MAEKASTVTNQNTDLNVFSEDDTKPSKNGKLKSDVSPVGKKVPA